MASSIGCVMAMPISSLLHRPDVDPHDGVFIDGATGEQLCWRDLRAHAGIWRALARRRHVVAGDRVGLVIESPLDFTAVYLSALATGHTVVPLDPRAPLPDVAGALTRLRVDVLVSDRPDVLDMSTGLETWCADRHGPSPRRLAGSGTRPSHGVIMRPAVLLASSGTTGAPKGIPLEQSHLLHAATRIARHHRLSTLDRGYTAMPLFHVNAQVVGLLTTLVSGGSLLIDRRFEADAYWDHVAAFAPTWLNTVPAVLTALLDHRPPNAATTASIRFARSASAPLPAVVHRRFEEHTGIGILETYGMTEAASQITANPLDPAARRPGSVGMPTGVGVAVLTPDGRRAAAGEIGVVHLRGAGVVGSYLDVSGHGVETPRAARDSAGWLCTGDAGFFSRDGSLHLAGRVDDVINRGGEKFYPAEVEDIILTHIGVAATAVAAVPHQRLGQVAVAFVVPRTTARATLAEELRGICETSLPRYKRPAEIRIAAALPVGATGKVRRRELVAVLAAA
jgi:acyl-CoA synthetase (AMP-forming)/AMP-acid ligase II